MTCKEIFKMPALSAGIFSVFSWDTAHGFPEDFGEVTHILKTAPYSDVGHLVPGLCQQSGSLLNPVLPQILDRSGTDGRAETAKTFAFADGSTGSDGSGAEFSAELTVNTAEHSFDALGIPQILAADRGSGGGEMAAKKPDKL